MRGSSLTVISTERSEWRNLFSGQISPLRLRLGVVMTHGYRQVVIISDDRRAISGFSILLRYQPSNCCLSLIENAFCKTVE